MKPWHCEIDLDAGGRGIGIVRFAAGAADGEPSTVSPIACIAGGKGPTIVLTAGIHGDEYEGQVALSEVMRQLDPAAVRGRIIIMPATNTPACIAGQRLSPVDGQNLNRAFPGKSDGSITQRIACFIETELYARADFAVDIHGGGVLLHFLPSTIIVVTADEEENRRRLDLATMFGAAHCMLFGDDTMGVDVSIDAAMIRQGVIGITGEYGGSGEITGDALDICRRGVRNVLSSCGLVADRPAGIDRQRPVIVDVRNAACYVSAEVDGVLEPLVSLGAHVTAGGVLALLHHPETRNGIPTPVLANAAGIVMARRALARSSVGDWLFIIGQPVEEVAPDISNEAVI